MPGLTWRIFVGPLTTFFADFMVFISNSCVVWAVLCIAETITIRALLLMKFKYVGGINDYFFSKFIFMFNIGFTFGFHFGLFSMGSLGSDELLTGMIISLLCRLFSCAQATRDASNHLKQGCNH